MTITGILMYFLAPIMIGILTLDPEIRALGVTILRIEAFAEPYLEIGPVHAEQTPIMEI